jgi:tight adherence protein B
MNSATWWLGRIASLLLVATLALGSEILFGAVEAPGQRAVRHYVTALDQKLRFVRASTRGIHVFVGQVAFIVATLIAVVCTHEWLWLLPLPACLVGPRAMLTWQAARRVARVEEQIEPWINAVANALKASPSLGEALCSTVTLVPSPMSQELDVLIKEYELGTPLDDALENLGRRIGSKTLSGTVMALKIARRSGGNLTEMLETAAASLREFARLEGVVRSKTAEGKAQAFVIGFIPAPLVLLIHSIDSHFFEPLFHSLLGQLVIAGAVLLWTIGILAARKILDVDV